MKKTILLISVFFLVVSLFPFRFAVIGDSRPNNPKGDQPLIYERMLWEIDKIGVDFLINTGDVVAGYGNKTRGDAEREYKKFKNVMDKYLEVPWYVAPGNHDYAGKDGSILFKQYIGKPQQAFVFNNSYFIIANTTSHKTSKGALNAAKYHWLKKHFERAKAYKHLFVAFHHPLKFSPIGFERKTWASPNWKKRFIQLLENQPNLAYVFQGHNHYFDEYIENGVKYITTGGGGARLYLPPQKGGYFHYLLVDVDGDKVDYKVVIPYTFDVKIKKINSQTKEVIFYNNLPKPIKHLYFRGIKVVMPKSRHYTIESENSTARIRKIKSYDRKNNLLYISFVPITGKYGEKEYEVFKIKALK